MASEHTAKAFIRLEITFVARLEAVRCRRTGQSVETGAFQRTAAWRHVAGDDTLDVVDNVSSANILANMTLVSYSVTRTPDYKQCRMFFHGVAWKTSISLSSTLRALRSVFLVWVQGRQQTKCRLMFYRLNWYSSRILSLTWAAIQSQIVTIPSAEIKTEAKSIRKGDFPVQPPTERKEFDQSKWNRGYLIMSPNV